MKKLYVYAYRIIDKVCGTDGKDKQRGIACAAAGTELPACPIGNIQNAMDRYETLSKFSELI